MKSWHSTLWLVSVSESRRDDFAPVLVGRMRQKTRVYKQNHANFLDGHNLRISAQLSPQQVDKNRPMFLRKGAIDAKQYCLFRSKLTVAEGEGPTDRSELGE
jgi:hypothetical protein